MNPTLEGLFTRKSVRVFLEKPIPEAVKRDILTAAAQAPTAGNQQLYTILDITDRTLKDRLAVSCDHQPFIAAAPLVLIFCADVQKWYDLYLETGCAPRLPGAGDLMLAVTDAAIAAQNAVVAAWSMGVGSCYIGDVMERCEEHRAMLGLPEYVFPAAMLVLGYPTPQQLEHEKPPRMDLTYVVHENGYRRMDGARLREAFSVHAGARTPEDWCRAFCQRKYQSGFSREMTRSVLRYLDAFRFGRAGEAEAPPAE